MKTIFKKYISLLFLLTAGTIFFSCTPESCMEQTESFVMGVFYIDDDTGLAKAPDTLTVYGIGREDSLLYNKTIRTPSVLLPLDAGRSSCSFVFIINSAVDTITLDYTNYQHFISRECGYTYFHKLNPISRSYENNTRGITGVSIKNNSVTIPNEENIRIFFR